jgi:hypothetical protein
MSVAKKNCSNGLVRRWVIMQGDVTGGSKIFLSFLPEGRWGSQGVTVRQKAKTSSLPCPLTTFPEFFSACGAEASPAGRPAGG